MTRRLAVIGGDAGGMAAAAQAQIAAAAGAAPATDIKFCAIDDPTCEACQ